MSGIPFLEGASRAKDDLLSCSITDVQMIRSDPNKLYVLSMEFQQDMLILSSSNLVCLPKVRE